MVDDSPTIRKVVRSVLEAEAECKVCGEAINGQDAIEKAAQLHPDMVVLDFAMPVMNGIEAARVLSKNMPDVPLIMLTSHANRLVEPEARAAGMSAVLSKETGMKKLVELCVKLLHCRSSRNGSASTATLLRPKIAARFPINVRQRTKSINS